MDPTFVDIHSHIIPNLDDGPATIQETCQLLRKAHQDGTRAIVATPHMFSDLYPNQDPVQVQEHFHESIGQLRKLAQLPENAFLDDLEFFLGAENFVSFSFLKALEHDGILTLNQGHYLLVEFPVLVSKDLLARSIQRILANGYVPVLAHLERYALVQRDPLLAEAFLELGCITQVNADTLAKPFWSKDLRTANFLLRKNLVSVIASDAHRPSDRPSRMGQAYGKLRESFPEDVVEGWTLRNPFWLISHSSNRRRGAPSVLQQELSTVS